MVETVQACKKHNVKCSAHPGLPDLQGFGHREMKLSSEELTAITVYQVGSLKGFLDHEGILLSHVKPHGALYGMMCRDYDVAKAVMQGIPKGVSVLGLAGTNMKKAANDVGVPVWAEFYGDVKYTNEGHLIFDRRKKPWKTEDVKAHVKQQLEEHSVTSVEGMTVELPVKDYHVSVCCHSDSPGCLNIIKATKEVIEGYIQTLR